MLVGKIIIKPNLPTILIGVEDPGAANAIAPIIAALIREKRVNLNYICHENTKNNFDLFNIPFNEQELDIINDNITLNYLNLLKPQLVIIGTSENNLSIDRTFLINARNLRIPVFCILDYWNNLAERFSNKDRTEYLSFLPNKLFVMDKTTKDNLIKTGVSSDIITVTGHPGIDSYDEIYPQIDKRIRDEYIKSLNIDPNSKIVTFVSETFGWKYDNTYRFPMISGNNERTIIILEHIIKALNELVKLTGIKITLINKLHPKNNFEEFELFEKNNNLFNIITIKYTNKNYLIKSSSLILGITSMLVLESAYLGIPTLSVIPREVEEKIGPDNKPFWAVARNTEELKNKLYELLIREQKIYYNDLEDFKKQHKGAVSRAVQEIYKIL